ncbi:MAG TPA: transcriptional regulator GcvA [Stellaceae bacterium]|nr:transcriptional regulator GcvA [Stellaceae bacterium]
MRRRLPPLNAVRAFEAAARHLSFLKAADELAVTPGAISQQIRALEEWLTIPLFKRLPRGVLLTDAGQLYGLRLRALLDQLAEETLQVQRHANSTQILTVGVMPSFAAQWLIPRLGSFNEAYPALSVRVDAAPGLSDFTTDDVDMAIRFGSGVYPGLRCELMFAEEVFPVCSPRLLAGSRPLTCLADLAHHTLLHDERGVDRLQQLDWEVWLRHFGVTGFDPLAGPSFTYTHMTLQAAAAGQGVALCSSVLVGDGLATGRLVRPFPEVMSSPYSYWVVAPEASMTRPAVTAFRNWALEEGRRFLADTEATGAVVA